MRHPHADILHAEGMTLRDYFAAAAMQAIITANGTFDYDEEPVALNAYRMADAMLKKRERGE